MPTAVEQILWTAVPNGLSTAVGGGTQLNISVVVSPNLSGGATGTLSDFTDLQNWPDLISSNLYKYIRFEFTDSSKASLGAYSALIDTAVLSNALWLELFSPASSIQYSARDAGEPYDNVPIVSYPSDQVATWLQNTYAQLATSSPTSYPSTDTLAPLYGPIGGVSSQAPGVYYGLLPLQAIWNRLSGERLSNPLGGPLNQNYNDWSSATNDNASTWFAALRFYHMVHQDPKWTPQPPPALPTVDFHRALTFISQHGTLQRALGLVLDLVVPANAVRAGSSLSDFYVSAQLSDVDGAAFRTSSGVTYTPVTPRTQCNYSASVFEAFPATSQIASRQLTLGDSTSFAIYEVDVDGGGLKTTQFADNLQLAQSPQSGEDGSANGPAPDAPDSYAPPSLRSAGLSVAAVNRGMQFANALKRGGTLWSTLPSNGGAGSVPDLTAEDLVSGFVLDVWDATSSAWYSTALRDVTYTAGQVMLSATDEPGLDSPPRSQNDPTNSSQPQLNVPANLIRWTGWSNAAPRPGSPLADDASSGVSSGPGSGPFDQLAIGGPNGSAAPTPHPGSLPRLRYGRFYALRARVVDIAGNVISLAQATANGAVVSPTDSLNRVSPLAVYGRLEPVGSPDIYTFNADPFPGESLKRLVIRDIDPSITSMRAFAPNRVAESFAETHSEFDTGTGGTLDPNAYGVITESDAATFNTDREQARYPGTLTPAGAQVWSSFPLTSPVPFLPDPLARGGTLLVTLGPLTGTSQQFDFSPASGQSWPNYQPYGLVLAPGASQALNADATTRELTVTLTKGDTVDLQLSSYFKAADLFKFGLAWWIESFYAPGSPPTSLGDSIVGGLTWAFTPWTNVELVYAVQKPLLVPTFTSMSPLKQLAWTYAEIFGDITYSPKSTSHTDLLATWDEPVDNGSGTGVPQGPGVPAPNDTLAPRQSTVSTLSSSHKQLDSETDRLPPARHEFFDTKHRFVGYYGKATSSFSEHYQGTSTFTAPTTGTATALNLPGHPGLGLEPGSVTVTDSSGKTYDPDTDFTLDTTAGTITFTATGPSPGTTVTVKFLPPVSVDSATTVLNILSSARPLSADVEFIVPIFKWARIQRHGRRTLSGRTPTALRVFMSRPWWSSGIGELLGVTTYPLSENFYSADIPDPDNLFVSDWGLDPVFRGPKIGTGTFAPSSYGKLPSPHPRLESFPARVHTGTNLTIDEVSGVKVDVAGHGVHYDERRDLWYADILVDIGQAYTPMIRLALARYQPDSVPGAELSRIVLADVMSLDPARIVSVVRGGPTLLRSVTLAGYSYSEAADQSGLAPGLATLVVERRVTQIHDDVIGWEPVDKPIEMRAITGPGGITYWTARNIKIPAGGQHRLFIAQYEILPADRRRASVDITYVPSRGLRLLYQDLIPL